MGRLEFKVGLPPQLDAVAVCLPGRPYLSGFLQSLAPSLKLDGTNQAWLTSESYAP